MKNLCYVVWFPSLQSRHILIFVTENSRSLTFFYADFQTVFSCSPHLSLSQARCLEVLNGFRFFYSGIDLFIVFFPFWISSISFSSGIYQSSICQNFVVNLSCCALLEFGELAEINMYYTHTFILFFSWQCVKFILLSLAKFEGHSHIAKSIIRCFLMPSNCWESFFFSFPPHSKYV